MKYLIAHNNCEKVKDYITIFNKQNIDYDITLSVSDTNQYDGLIIPGGNDVTPSLYNQKVHPSVVEYDEEFDKQQLAIVDKFVREDKKIMGICRGLQLLNVYFKGDLIQDINSLIAHRNSSNYFSSHSIENSDYMLKLYGKFCTVNSFHHQAINRLADDLVMVSISNDGIIEAVKHKNKKIIAVQFHPEVKSKENEIDGLKLFDFFKGL